MTTLLATVQPYDWPNPRRGFLPRRTALHEAQPVTGLMEFPKEYQVTVTWNPGGSTAYDNPTLLGCTIRRGRVSEQLSVEQGRAVLVCFDPDGIYNPANGSSPLGANLKLMRRVQLTLRPVGGATAPLFTGFVSRIVHDPRVGQKTTTIEAVDGFEVLNLVYPVITATGTTTTGAIVGLILDAAGVSAADRSVDAGAVAPSYSADGTRTALQLIDDLLLVDRGIFFVAADGKHTYRDRSSVYGRRTAAATLTQETADVVLPAVDVLNIVNKQTVRKLPSGVAQTATDATSQTDYKTRTGELIESLVLVDDNQAASLASFIVFTRKSPDIPTRTLRLPGLTTPQLEQQAARDVGNIVGLSGLGTQPEARIEGITHRYDRNQHVTEYALTTRSVVGFTIGLSTVGGPDQIAY